jgi:hypothetical protein
MNTPSCFIKIASPYVNQIGKVYSAEYTYIPKVFFMPHLMGVIGNG